MAEVLCGHVELSGHCYHGTFTHSHDDDFANFRHRVPIYSGDWEFQVKAIPQRKHNPDDGGLWISIIPIKNTSHMEWK